MNTQFINLWIRLWELFNYYDCSLFIYLFFWRDDDVSYCCLVMMSYVSRRIANEMLWKVLFFVIEVCRSWCRWCREKIQNLTDDWIFWFDFFISLHSSFLKLKVRCVTGWPWYENCDSIVFTTRVKTWNPLFHSLQYSFIFFLHRKTSTRRSTTLTIDLYYLKYVVLY